VEIDYVAACLLNFFDFLRFPSEARLTFGRLELVADRFDLDTVAVIIVVDVNAKVYTPFVRRVCRGARAEASRLHWFDGFDVDELDCLVHDAAK
jgi:hypothetical protein